MVLVKQINRTLPGGLRKWYVKLFKTKEGYHVEYDTEDGSEESHHYALKSSALRRFKKEARSLLWVDYRQVGNRIIAVGPGKHDPSKMISRKK